MLGLIWAFLIGNTFICFWWQMNRWISLTNILQAGAFSGRPSTAEFFVKAYLSGRLSHYTYYGMAPYTHLPRSGVCNIHAKEDELNVCFSHTLYNYYTINLYHYFENPFNPTSEELLLWELEGEDPYEGIMDNFLENWRE